MDNKQKQVKNLFKKLINDQNSVFYSSDKITRTLLNKGRKSSYEKDKVFYKILNLIEDKGIINDFDTDKPKLQFSMQFFHTDLVYLQFFAKSAAVPKYALVCVDLCLYNRLYNVYTIENLCLSMRKKSNLVQKMELFYKEIEQKRNQKEKMRLQVDLEFQNITLKCSVQKLEVEKLLQPNKKLENLKKFYLGVSVYIN